MQLQYAAVVDVVDGGLAGRPNILLDIRPVDKGQINGPGDVGGGEDEHVGKVPDIVQLGQHGVHHAHSVARLRARVLAHRRQALHLVDQHADERARLIDELPDLGEHLLYQLPRLREPLGEEAV